MQNVDAASCRIAEHWLEFADENIKKNK